MILCRTRCCALCRGMRLQSSVKRLTCSKHVCWWNRELWGVDPPVQSRHRRESRGSCSQWDATPKVMHASPFQKQIRPPWQSCPCSCCNACHLPATCSAV